jgi:hypothetical protein
MNNAEIIRCKCGVVFAACVEGHQDKEWDKNKRQYLKAGCTREIVPFDSFRFGSCDCKKTEPKEPKVILDLFNQI